MLMRTDPFRDLDRLTQQLMGTTARPSAMAMDVSGSFIEKRPPNPQQRSASGHATCVEPSAATRCSGASWMRSSRSMWHEWW